MNNQQATETLVESFHALAGEVQSLIDRKTILEHKLRYAHEQYQYLADKYAPAAVEISETLAKLQLPPELRQQSPTDTSFVPLPKRGQAAGDSQHQIALLIREGRKAAQQLASLEETRTGSGSGKVNLSPVANTATPMSAVLEQDFTVEGKKGQLDCPFSTKASEQAINDRGESEDNSSTRRQDPTPHQSSDPICAAMFEEVMPASAAAPASGSAAAKCPIRFLDQHSPEEIAHYVETHKHEIPRSHEVCVRRYQRNEEQIRKLDAKYGNLVNMIQDLSQLHQPMLRSATGAEPQDEVDRASNERVESWAQAVSAGDADDPEHADGDDAAEDAADDRESHFDRPLKEVRVGESPSRPWGISVPVRKAGESAFLGQGDGRPVSPPPAPVRMPSPVRTPRLSPARGASKCPFDHTKLGFGGAPVRHQPVFPEAPAEEKGTDGSSRVDDPFSPARLPQATPSSPPNPPREPAFVNPADTSGGTTGQNASQMVFTGPVFIGYPVEQAIQLMQHWQGEGADR